MWMRHRQIEVFTWSGGVVDVQHIVPAGDAPAYSGSSSSSSSRSSRSSSMTVNQLDQGRGAPAASDRRGVHVDVPPARGAGARAAPRTPPRP